MHTQHTYIHTQHTYIHTLASKIMCTYKHLVEQNGDDEVIEGKPLREVGIVEVEEEESEGKDEVLLRGVCQGTAYQLHPHHCHHKGCTTVGGEGKVR